MTPGDEAKIRDALSRATTTCDRWAGREGDERDSELAAALDALTEARAPLSAWTRTGPRTGRRVSAHPWHVLNRDVATALQRLRDLRRSHPGHTARARKHPKGTSATALRQSLARASQEIRSLREEHAAMRRTVSLFDMAELRERADEIDASVRSIEGRINQRWQEYAQDWPKRRDRAVRKGQSPHTAKDADRDLYGRVRNVRADLAALRAEVQPSRTRAAPLTGRGSTHEPYTPWDAGQIMTAWERFRSRHGRLPTKREHGRDGLPTYNQLRRVVGERPMTAMQSLLK